MPLDESRIEYQLSPPACSPMPTSPPTAFPLDLADRCVKCGLCLPHCPTYLDAGVEGESPRGRIALMQGLATGRLDPEPGLVAHLEHCLGCRACEAACPAAVPYGELIDAGRALVSQRGAGPGPARSALAALLRRPRLFAALVRLGRLPGVSWLARRLGGLPARAAALLPPRARSPERSVAATAGTRGTVQLFLGCVSYALDGRSLDDTRRALSAAGYAVDIPRRQGCCGAVDLHAGRPDRAARLARRNLAAFAGAAPVVACATGCAATLLEYGRHGGADGAGLARRVVDPAQLLADADLPLRAGPWRKVALHVPCSQRHVTGTADATRRLLARLPGLAVRELPAGCCGAAGEHLLSQPVLADRLVAPLVSILQADPPDALVTGNIGCALHLGAALRRAGLDLPVLHPSSLVVAALESDA